MPVCFRSKRGRRPLPHPRCEPHRERHGSMKDDMDREWVIKRVLFALVMIIALGLVIGSQIVGA